jgi:hypothetical protein
METTNEPMRYFSSNSLAHSNVFYISGKFAFSIALLDLFTDLLINCHSTFLGFCTTIISTIVRNDPSKNDFFNVDYLAKRFEYNWLIYQTIHFQLMLGKSFGTKHLVAVPRSSQPDVRDVYFEELSSYLYHLFVVFWSRHKNITNVCQPGTCSRCLVTDGHQKPKRLICRVNDVVDKTIPEMGPVIIGCPYAPLRRSNEKVNGKKASSGSLDGHSSEKEFSPTN